LGARTPAPLELAPSDAAAAGAPAAVLPDGDTPSIPAWATVDEPLSFLLLLAPLPLLLLALPLASALPVALAATLPAALAAEIADIGRLAELRGD
jgi:hypothetical protein